MDWDFATQLARYGPGGTCASASPAEAWQYCRQVSTRHYENFTVASLLLPRHLLRHFHAVYAYCRWSDDLADETSGRDEALRLLAWWRGELLACYEGQARHPVFVALHETIRRFAIPMRPFDDLLTAFTQDQHVTHYATFEDLLGYCKNSANPVGRIVLHLFECHNEESGALSDSICTALQLANFWQDVTRDLDLGRVYLPEEDRVRFGYPDDSLRRREFTPAFAELMRFEVERTRDLFFRGYPLVDRVPPAVSADVELFVEGGLAILRKIEQQGYDVLSRRPVVSRWEKGKLVSQAVWRRLRGVVGAG
jgi:squalene synthase HpnC